MQQMNLLSNLPAETLTRVHSVCAGLAGSPGKVCTTRTRFSSATKRQLFLRKRLIRLLLWVALSLNALMTRAAPFCTPFDCAGTMTMEYRPWSTTSTRDWSPKSERDHRTIDITVHLKTLKMIFNEAKIALDTRMKIMKVDCEGCEYAVIPALTEPEFLRIDDMIGEIHWGYIGEANRPSLAVAHMTHHRMCQFKNFVDLALECCMYADRPNLPAPTARGLCNANPAWLTQLN